MLKETITEAFDGVWTHNWQASTDYESDAVTNYITPPHSNVKLSLDYFVEIDDRFKNWLTKSRFTNNSI